MKKSIMRATTDSEGEVRFDIENKPGISNLMNIYAAFSGMPVAEIQKKYAGCGYGEFKKDLVQVTVESLAPIKARYEEIRHSEELLHALADGRERANVIAEKTMSRVKDRFGLGIHLK